MEDELLREVTQRRMLAWLAGLAAVLHMLAFFAPSEYRQGLVRVPAGYGFLATLLVLWLNGKPRWDRVMRGVILSIVAAWLGMDLFQGMRLGRGVSTWMVLDTVLMSVMLFSFLPPRAAILGSVVTYGCFLVMAWLAGGRDVLLLVYVGLLLAFAAYLALHGQLVARERMRADVPALAGVPRRPDGRGDAAGAAGRADSTDGGRARGADGRPGSLQDRERLVWSPGGRRGPEAPDARTEGARAAR